MATKNQTNQELDLAALKKEKAKVIEALNKIQEIEINEYRRKYYQKNKEKINEWSRKYYQKNKEQKNEYSREYKQKNKEKINEWSRKWYQKNKEQKMTKDFNRVKLLLKSFEM